MSAGSVGREAGGNDPGAPSSSSRADLGGAGGGVCRRTGGADLAAVGMLGYPPDATHGRLATPQHQGKFDNCFQTWVVSNAQPPTKHTERHREQQKANDVHTGTCTHDSTLIERSKRLVHDLRPCCNGFHSLWLHVCMSCVVPLFPRASTTPLSLAQRRRFLPQHVTEHFPGNPSHSETHEQPHLHT